MQHKWNYITLRLGTRALFMKWLGILCERCWVGPHVFRMSQRCSASVRSMGDIPVEKRRTGVLGGTSWGVLVFSKIMRFLDVYIFVHTVNWCLERSVQVVLDISYFFSHLPSLFPIPLRKHQGKINGLQHVKKSLIWYFFAVWSLVFVFGRCVYWVLCKHRVFGLGCF